MGTLRRYDDRCRGDIIISALSWLSPRNFFQGGAKSIVMQIPIVILLFSDQISGRGKSFQGGKLAQGAPPAPLWEKAS